MSELPNYIRFGVHFSVLEIELLIASICAEQRSIRYVDRYLYSRLTDYEILHRNNTINDAQRQDYLDWKEICSYFSLHKFSFERQFFKKRTW